MKLDFDDPSQTKLYELADGEFATEPIFVSNNGPSEDDGYILMQTIDGKSKKAAIVILNTVSHKKGSTSGATYLIFQKYLEG